MAKANKKASKKDVTFMYNKTEDILVVGKHKKYRKVKASIDMGEVLLDVSTRGSIIGIEILNASTNIGISKESLLKIKDVSFNVRCCPDFTVVQVGLYLDKEAFTHTTHLSINRETLLA